MADINLILNTQAAGTGNIIVALYSPSVTSLVNGRIYAFISTNPNTSTTPTLNINGLGAKTIKKQGGVALAVSDIGATGSQAFVSYRSTGDYFELINPQGSDSGVAWTTFAPTPALLKQPK